MNETQNGTRPLKKSAMNIIGAMYVMGAISIWALAFTYPAFPFFMGLFGTYDVFAAIFLTLPMIIGGIDMLIEAGNL